MTSELTERGLPLQVVTIHKKCFRVHGLYEWETHRKMLLAVANELKQGLSNGVMNIDFFIQSFKRHVHCLSSSGSYKLWLSETGQSPSQPSFGMSHNAPPLRDIPKDGCEGD